MRLDGSRPDAWLMLKLSSQRYLPTSLVEPAVGGASSVSPWSRWSAERLIMATAGGVPLLAGFVAVAGLGILGRALSIVGLAKLAPPIVGLALLALPIVGLAMTVLGAARVWRRAEGSAIGAAGVVLLLMIAAPIIASVPADDPADLGVALAALLGFIGLAGCYGASMWLVRGGTVAPAVLGWLGGLANLAGACWGAGAARSCHSWDELGFLALAILSAIGGCTLMVTGAAAMRDRTRQHRVSG
jgi:hypothetical protein